MTSLQERYRPATWADVAGQRDCLDIIDRLRPNGLTGRAWWISGPTGTGKSTIARLLAQECCTPIQINEIDGTAVSAAYLEAAEETLRYRPLFGKASAWIVNEAHRIRADLMTRMLVMLDPPPDHALWVFTTTSDAQQELWDKKLDAAPFLGRCEKLKTKVDPLAFAIRARKIAAAEGLDGKPIDQYVALCRRHGGNMREILREIENGGML